MAVVGVGRMGAGMASRLKDVGYRIAAVYDADERRRDAVAAELQTTPAASLAEVARLAKTVLTAVSDERAMDRIYGNSGDSLLLGGPDMLFVNTATVSPEMHIEIERRTAAQGSLSLEACLLGTVPHARAGSLYVLAAGDEEAFRRAEPLLREISAKIRYAGSAGQAGKVKAVVNMVMNINVAGLAEGLGLGEALGLGADLLLEALQHSAAASRALDTRAQAMLSGDYGQFLTAEHAAKDAGIALDLAKDTGIALPLAQAVKGQLDRMLTQGLGQEDLAGVAALTFPRRARGAQGS